MATVTEQKRKQATQRVEQYIKTSKKKDRYAGLRHIAENEPHEVGNALDELAQVFGDISTIFSGLAGDANNFKQNLDLAEPPRTASLRDRVAARRNYAKTLRRLATEEPEELGAAISAVYDQIDVAAEGIEALAERFGLPLDTHDEEGIEEEGIDPGPPQEMGEDDYQEEPAPPPPPREERIDRDPELHRSSLRTSPPKPKSRP